MAGVLSFGIGGVADLIWHTLFGVEVGLEGFLSPNHLTRAVGIALIVSGPLVAAGQRSSSGRRSRGWKAQLPALASLTLLLSVLTFMTQFAYPLVTMPGAQGADGGGAGVVEHPIWLRAFEATNGAHIWFHTTVQLNPEWPLHDLPRIGTLPGVVGTVGPFPIAPFQASLLGHDGPLVLTGLPADLPASGAPKVVDGRWLAAGGTDEIVLDPLLARRVTARVGDLVQIKTSSGVHSLRVVGLALDPSWPIILPAHVLPATLQAVTGGQRLDYRFGVRLAEPARGAEFQAQAQKLFPPGIRLAAVPWDWARVRDTASGTGDQAQVAGLLSIVLHTAISMGLIFYDLGRQGPPPGAMTLGWGLNASLMGLMTGDLLSPLVALTGGAVADLLLRTLDPSAGGARLRVFAAIVPITFYGCYFLLVAVTDGLAWSVPWWTGSIALAGLTGLMVSYLTSAPRGTAPRGAA